MATDPLDVLAQVDDWEPDTVAVGVASREATLAVHGPVDEIFAIASVTKPLTGYATLIAVQDGLLHLDEPAGPEPDDGITVRHLLAHASGLPTEKGGPTSEPGQRRVYSNYGYELLGGLVAARTDRSFAQHLDVELLQPLGMSDTTLEGSPASGAKSTVSDLLTFARELLAPTILEAELHRTATTVAFPGLEGVLPGYGRQSPNDWGLGVEIRSKKEPHWTGNRFSTATFGHFGRSGSYLWVDPDVGLASVGLADLDFGTWAIEAWPDFSDAIRQAFS